MSQIEGPLELKGRNAKDSKEEERALEIIKEKRNEFEDALGEEDVMKLLAIKGLNGREREILSSYYKARARLRKDSFFRGELKKMEEGVEVEGWWKTVLLT